MNIFIQKNQIIFIYKYIVTIFNSDKWYSFLSIIIRRNIKYSFFNIRWYISSIQKRVWLYILNKFNILSIIILSIHSLFSFKFGNANDCILKIIKFTYVHYQQYQKLKFWGYYNTPPLLIYFLYLYLILNEQVDFLSYIISQLYTGITVLNLPEHK